MRLAMRPSHKQKTRLWRRVFVFLICVCSLKHTKTHQQLCDQPVNETVGTFVGTPRAIWHISAHLKPCGYICGTTCKSWGCRLSVSKSVSCEKRLFRFSR